MWYEVHPTPVKGEDGKNLVYVRPKSGMKLTMRQLEDQCERYNALRYGELSRAFEAFIRVAGRFLAEGYRIETPIGSFAPKLSLTKQVTDPDQVKDRDVRLDGVEYNPGKLWGADDARVPAEISWLHHCRPVCPLYRTDPLLCPQTAERVDQGRQSQTAENIQRQGAYLYGDINWTLTISVFETAYRRTVVCV